MMKYLVVCVVATFLEWSEVATLTIPTPEQSKVWAVLVAGSSGYGNYRHQADICHAYQILKRNNIPDDNIIVMMTDDIAYNPENPTPGVIINKPNGTDVYKGVKKDYTGKNVTVNNFFNVLLGKKNVLKNIGSGKVVESGENDIVFVNFVDHGGPGNLEFPDEELSAAAFHKVLDEMVKKKRFQKLILYIEACFSGSMFDAILEDNSNIFVMTAADNKESSYACYWDETLGTYLGDVFSVNWMEAMDQGSLGDKSLNHLFEKVRTNTINSHVEEYGDLDIGNTLLKLVLKTNSNIARLSLENNQHNNDPNKDAVPSGNVPLEILKRKLEKENDQLLKKEVHQQIVKLQKKRLYANKIINKILLKITGRDGSKMHDLQSSSFRISKENMYCSERVTRTLSESCFRLSKNPYIGQILSSVLNACNVNYIDEESIKTAIRTVCSGSMKYSEIV